MNLIDENYNRGINNKKMIVLCGTCIVILIFAIIVLLAIVSTFKKTTTTLSIDSYTYSNLSKILIENDGELYIGIEDITKLLSNGYNFKRGSTDGIDDNKCYISNLYESTYFEVGSKYIRKVIEETDETSFYELDNVIIKENGKIYIPLSGVKVAMNTTYSKTDTNISIKSIDYLEKYYNSSSMVQDESIVWNTSYSNKKMLKEGLVIIQDNAQKYGVATISATGVNKKTKMSTVLTLPIIDPKYNSIKYIEKYDILVVETNTGKGILQLVKENDKYVVEQKVGPQYEDIYPINENLFRVAKSDGKQKMQYGVIDQIGNIIVPIQYAQIGIDISKYDDFNLKSDILLYDSLIPIKKDDLFGIVDLKGNVVLKSEYTNLGCTKNNIESNVLIIPELNGIVVEKNNKYGIINKNGKVISNPEISKIYKEIIDGELQYSMLYNNKKYNVVSYFGGTQTKTNNNQANNTNKSTTKSTTAIEKNSSD